MNKRTLLTVGLLTLMISPALAQTDVDQRVRDQKTAVNLQITDVKEQFNRTIEDIDRTKADYKRSLERQSEDINRLIKDLKRDEADQSRIDTQMVLKNDSNAKKKLIDTYFKELKKVYENERDRTIAQMRANLILFEIQARGYRF